MAVRAAVARDSAWDRGPNECHPLSEVCLCVCVCVCVCVCLCVCLCELMCVL